MMNPDIVRSVIDDFLPYVANSRLGCYSFYMIGHGMTAEEKTVGENAGASWDFSESAELIVARCRSLRVLASDGFQAFTLREGEGVFIPPRTVSAVVAASEGAVIHRISFPLSLIWGDENSAVYRKYSEPLLSLCAAVSLSPGAARKAEEAYAVLSEKAYCYELIARNLITEVLVTVLVENEGSASPSSGYANERILAMLTFIKEHYNENIRLGDIARAVNVSERECLRSFRKALGTSPEQYLIAYRLSEGVKMLENSNLQIAEIAYKTGFDSPAHFSRSFKSLYGFSPSRWRSRLL